MNFALIIYVLLFLVGVLSCSLLYLYYRFTRERKIANLPQENYQDRIQVVEDAQKQANEIVQRAVESAKHILFETNYLKQDISKEMQDSLQKVADQTIKMVQNRSVESEEEFRKVVDEIKQEFAKQASEKLKDITEVANKETVDFQDVLRRETLGSQMYIGKKINEQFDTVQKDIDVYKQEQLKKVDENISKLVKQIAQEVISSSITLPIHETLILDALARAQKDGIFKNLELESKKEGEAIKYGTASKA